MTQKDVQSLRLFKRKILRSILGAVKDRNIWRRRYNLEPYKLYEAVYKRHLRLGKGEESTSVLQQI